MRGKRVLIISSFVDSYKKKVDAGVLDKIYGIDLFPECKLLFLKPPQTQGSNPSEEFDVELERFAKQIEGIKDQFDVALCSCGGYGNLVCGKIFEMGKSAIYVGGVLQMYFGVLGQRWLRERPDIVRLFMNEVIGHAPKIRKNLRTTNKWKVVAIGESHFGYEMHPIVPYFALNG